VPTPRAEDDRDAGRQLTARLDAHFTAWEAALSPAERTALEAYCGDRNFFRAVNAVLRGADVAAVPARFARRVLPARRAIADAIKRGAVPEPLTAYRGISDFEATFGVPPGEASGLAGQLRRSEGFLSTSISRRVAVQGFVNERSGALLDISVPAGTPAAWLPALRSDAFPNQLEMLFGDRAPLLVVAAAREGPILVLRCEMTTRPAPR
jgi:hypothetical protein